MCVDIIVFPSIKKNEGFSSNVTLVKGYLASLNTVLLYSYIEPKKNAIIVSTDLGKPTSAELVLSVSGISKFGDQLYCP